MGLVIKNRDAQRLARQLADETGETISEALTNALRERLKRVRRAEWLLAIGRDCAKRMKEPYRSANPDDLLYDDKGLPR